MGSNQPTIFQRSYERTYVLRITNLTSCLDLLYLVWIKAKRYRKGRVDYLSMQFHKIAEKAISLFTDIQKPRSLVFQFISLIDIILTQIK